MLKWTSSQVDFNPFQPGVALHIEMFIITYFFWSIRIIHLRPFRVALYVWHETTILITRRPKRELGPLQHLRWSCLWQLWASSVLKQSSQCKGPRCDSRYRHSCWAKLNLYQFETNILLIQKPVNQFEWQKRWLVTIMWWKALISNSLTKWLLT